MTMITLPGGTVVEVPRTVVDVSGITIHEHKADKHTIERWQKEAFEDLRDSYGPEIQEAENALWDVMLSRLIDYAAGAQLDMLGRIVGEGRNGRDDPGYRVRIRARIAINQSFGRAKDIITVLRLLDPAIVRVEDIPPAAIDVEFLEPPSGLATATELAGLLGETRAAGVGGDLIMPTDGTNDFIFSDVGEALTVNVGAQASIAGAGTLLLPYPTNSAGYLLLIFADGGVDTPTDWTMIETGGVFQTSTLYARLVTTPLVGSLSWVVSSGKVARMYAIRPPNDRTWKTPVTAAISASDGTGTGVTITGVPANVAGEWRMCFASGWGSTYTVSAVPSGWTIANNDPPGVGLGMVALRTSVDASAGDMTLSGGSGGPSWTRINALFLSDTDGEHGFSDDSDEPAETHEGGLLADARRF